MQRPSTIREDAPGLDQFVVRIVTDHLVKRGVDPAKARLDALENLPDGKAAYLSAVNAGGEPAMDKGKGIFALKVWSDKL